MNKKKEWARGSFTLEAACVMSLVLLVLMGTLYLCFYVHNRAWLTAAACESALAGSMEGIRDEGQAAATARMRSRELGNTGFFGAENLSVQVNAGKEVEVVYTGGHAVRIRRIFVETPGGRQSRSDRSCRVDPESEVGI